MSKYLKRHNQKLKDELIEIMKSRRHNIKILVTSTQYPMYGGAATNAYFLVKFLRSQSIPTSCIFFHNKIAICDPDNIGDIYHTEIALSPNLTAKQIEAKKAIIQKFGREPDIILGFNWQAPVSSKYLFPNSKVYYCTTGSHLITQLSAKQISYSQFMENYQLDVDHQYSKEVECIKKCDGVLFNSDIIKNIFSKIYFNYIDKFFPNVVSMTDICVNSSIIQSEDPIKTNDLIMVVSSCERKVKNIQLGEYIFSHFRDNRKTVIGNSSDKFFNNIPNTTRLPLSDHDTVYKHFSKSRLLLLPSFVESSGIVIQEALYNKCLVLTSRNVGFSQRLPDIFLCNDVYDRNEWIERTRYILDNFDILLSIYCNNITKSISSDHIMQFVKNDPVPVQYPEKKHNILFISIDTPYIGGSATNTYKMIDIFRTHTDHKIAGLFINKNKEHVTDPKHYGGIFRIINDYKGVDERINKYFNGVPTVIFAKNYISIYIAKKLYPNVRLIFSPSGSRIYSHHCGKNKFITYNEFMKIDTFDRDSKTDFCYPNSCKADCNCEYLAIKNSDFIVPNSVISEKLLKKVYPEFSPRILHSISITNVDYVKHNRPPFSERDIDIIACSYSWKRQVKNVELTMQILTDPIYRSKSLCIIGHDIPKKYKNCEEYPNITYIPNCDHNMLMTMFSRSKVYICASYYDASPNTIVEAAFMGCNIVTSSNTGQYAYTHQKFQVNHYNDIKDWHTCINNGFNEHLQYNGPQTNDILIDFKYMLRYCEDNESVPDFVLNENKNSAVLFHTTPAKWSFDESIVYEPTPIPINKSSEIDKTKIQSDIYYLMMKNYMIQSDIDELHIVFGGTNTSHILLSDIMPNESSNIHIWTLDNPNYMFSFVNADVYFIRGIYDRLFTDFFSRCTKPNKKIYYAATSVPFGIENITECPIKYDVVLCDDLDRYVEQLYPHSKKILMKKPAYSLYNYQGLQREYDMCFAATTKQRTKNHHLFIEYMRYLEKKKLKTSIVFVGDCDNDKDHTNRLENIAKNYKHVKLTLHKWLNHTQLREVYNKSKVNMLFSGRDAFPRVITETLCCGCYNIALDTISNAKWVFNGEYGELIRCEKVVNTKANSRSAVASDELFNEIYEKTQLGYNHKEISRKAMIEFNLYSTVNDIKMYV